MEIIRSNDIKASTNEILKHANTNIKNLRGFINKQIKSNVIPGLINKPKALQADSQTVNSENSLTSSISSTEINEIERQFSTMGKRHSAIVLKPAKQNIIPEMTRPDRAPPPIPLPYSKHREAKFRHTETGIPSVSEYLMPPPLPYRRVRPDFNEPKLEVNLISFDGPAQTNLFPSPSLQPQKQQSQKQQQQLQQQLLLQLQQQLVPPQPLPRRFTNPQSQTNYVSTTTTTTVADANTDLLLIKPATETNLDDLIRDIL